ncbi:hypothetical protein [Rhodococcus kronopolitis]|uniref:Secreted protein n=1 Tax=Rhodococcus kronopolitis TaxID=1460226 RepID=A0ABV9FV53_9NOCA
MVDRVVPSTEPPGDDAPEPDDRHAPERRAAGRAADLRARLRTTPYRLVLMAVALTVFALVAGGVAAAQVTDRQRTLDSLLTQIEPIAYASQDLYSSLSIADAAAATAFISGGLEPTEVRDRYTRAIDDAGHDLVDASAGIPVTDTTAHALLTELSESLPVYTGLIETARANNRIGYPVGAAYLREASTLMQTTLLPAAEQLHSAQAATVVSTQAEFATPPWPAIGLLLAALAALVVALVLLARWTRRTLNLGLVLAAAAVAALLGWLLIAGLVSSTATNHALDEGARPLSVLTNGRILAQQARADETLALVRRDVSGRYHDQFVDHLDRLGTLLDDYPHGGTRVGIDEIQAASEARAGWAAAHQRIDALLGIGDWSGAADVAVGRGSDDSAAYFAGADAALDTAIEQARAELRGNLTHAHSILSGLASGSLVLSVLAVVGIGVGLWPRWREYQ